jgi:hypothetical protein
LLPTVTLPKLRLAGFDPSTPGATPVPDNAIVSVGFEAFELIVTVPLALPVDSGVNVTLKVALWPPASVAGVMIPLRLNPVPLMPTCEIVTLEPPALVTVSDRDLLLPTVTLPRLRLVGFDPNAPGATPVPVSGMVRVELEAFEVTVRLPLTIPADAGVNLTLKVALCPAVSVAGVVIPLKLSPVPLMPTWEIVIVEPPVLVTVSDSD